MSESKTMKQLHSIREKNHERMKHLPAREWSREEHRAFISMRGRAFSPPLLCCSYCQTSSSYGLLYHHLIKRLNDKLFGVSLLGG